MKHVIKLAIFLSMVFSYCQADNFLSVVQTAFNTSPVWQETLSTIEKSTYQSQQVTSVWKPNVKITTGYQYAQTYNMKSPSKDINDYLHDQNSTPLDNIVAFYLGEQDRPQFQAQLIIQQMIFAGGRIPLSITAKQQSDQALHFLRQSKEQHFVLQIAQVYGDYIIDKQRVSILEDNVHRLTMQWQIAKTQYRSGVLPKTDMDLINAQLSGVRAQLIDAQDKLQTVRVNYINITGSQPTDTMALSDLSLSFNLPNNYVEVLNKADINNPDLLAAQANQNFYKTMVSFHRGELLPNIAIQMGTNYGNSSPGGENAYGWSIGGILTIPLYNSGLSWITYNSSISDQKKSVAQLVQTINTINGNAQIYFNQMQAASSRVRSYQFVESANYQAYQQSQAAYRLGLINVTDMLTWEDKWRNAQLDTIKANRDYFISRFALALLMGDLTLNHLFQPQNTNNKNITSSNN